MQYSQWMLIVAVSLILPGRSLLSSDWPRFRGPNGSGTSEAKGLPEQLDASKHVIWKIPMSRGLSSPIIVAGRIFITSHEGDERRLEGYDAATGERLWRHVVKKLRDEIATAPGGHANSTPVVAGNRVFAFFPDHGLIACSIEGDHLWTVELGPFKSMHGLASSLEIAGNRLILVADQLQDSFIAAYDVETGKPQWRHDRLNGLTGGYSTPVINKLDNGQSQVLALGPNELIAYNAESGEQSWIVSETGAAPISAPVIAGGRIFICNPVMSDPLPFSLMLSNDANKDGNVSLDEARGHAGIVRFLEKIDREHGNRDGIVDPQEWNKSQAPSLGQGGLAAIDLNGQGDVTKTHCRWRYTKQVPQIPSVLIYQDVLYTVQDGGLFTSFDPQTGEQLKRARLPAAGQYYASPVAGDSKIYVINTKGESTVITPGRSWESLSTGNLGESVWATPAIANDRIFVRSEKTLWCFGQNK